MHVIWQAACKQLAAAVTVIACADHGFPVRRVDEANFKCLWYRKWYTAELQSRDQANNCQQVSMQQTVVAIKYMLHMYTPYEGKQLNIPAWNMSTVTNINFSMNHSIENQSTGSMSSINHILPVFWSNWILFRFFKYVQTKIAPVRRQHTRRPRRALTALVKCRFRQLVWN